MVASMDKTKSLIALMTQDAQERRQERKHDEEERALDRRLLLGLATRLLNTSGEESK
jgi:hypothetical protein